MDEIWKRSNYISNIPYIVGQYITEYDIIKANINVLLFMGAISRELYDNLYNSDKHYREVYIGMMQRNDPRISELKSQGIEEFRKRFIQSNHLSDGDILSIKSDAIFVIGNPCQCTKFENIEFRIANHYDAYIRIGNLEIYYGYDRMNGEETIDVKGINDGMLELHRNYMMKFLCDMFYKLLSSGAEEAIKLSQQYLEVILTKSSPDPGYYRDFNILSGYVFRSHVNSYVVSNINSIDIPLVDTSTNIRFLQDLLSILSDIYLKNKK